MDATNRYMDNLLFIWTKFNALYLYIPHFRRQNCPYFYTHIYSITILFVGYTHLYRFLFDSDTASAEYDFGTYWPNRN